MRTSIRVRRQCPINTGWPIRPTQTSSTGSPSRTFSTVSGQLRYNILAYYYHYKPPYRTRKEQQDWLRTVSQLEQLRYGESRPVSAASR